MAEEKKDTKQDTADKFDARMNEWMTLGIRVDNDKGQPLNVAGEVAEFEADWCYRRPNVREMSILAIWRKGYEKVGEQDEQDNETLKLLRERAGEAA